MSPLELAGRYAWVDPDRSLEDDLRTELHRRRELVFSGHDHKLTVDVSRLTLTQPVAKTLEDYRVRAQWDISF